MNIFDQYLDKIKNVLLDLSKNGNIVLPEKMDRITAEIPPAKFNSDISTNVAMVLSKANNKSPSDLANILVKAIKDKVFDKIHGKELSYNNLLDVDAAVNLILEFWLNFHWCFETDWIWYYNMIAPGKIM